MPDTPFGAESGGSTPGWAERLADNLTSLDCVFSTLVDVQRRNLTLTQEEEERLGIQGAIDPCDLTHQTARSLSRVIEALGELPAFAENGLTALTALRNAIMALDDGNQPALLTPRKGVSLGQDNIGRRTYKAHLI